ncbi:MAG TPA: hypothetical protein VG942_03345 [Hyphomonadaceae bacterium]|nr:hypothetical protein [Hyphomonadaceae bacterium]
MTRALDQAEAVARRAVDDWLAHGKTCAAVPGASLQMFSHDQHLLDAIADAFEVQRAPASSWWSVYGLAWTRCSLDATFGFNAWVLPWVSPDTRENVIRRTNERFAEAAITACRARSSLS